MALQDLAVSLATFVAVSLNVSLLALMFGMDCRHKDHSWSNYMTYLLYFVSMSLVFAAFFIYLAARYNATAFAPLGASMLIFVAAAFAHYAAKRCGDVKRRN